MMQTTTRKWIAAVAAAGILVVTAAPAGADGYRRGGSYSPRGYARGGSYGGYRHHHHHDGDDAVGGFLLGLGVAAGVSALASAFDSPPRPRYVYGPVPVYAEPYYAPSAPYYAPSAPAYVPPAPAYVPSYAPSFAPAREAQPAYVPQQAPCEEPRPVYVPATTCWRERTVVEPAVYETRYVPEFAEACVPVFEERRVPVYGDACDPTTGARVRIVVGERTERVEVGTRAERRLVGQRTVRVCVRPEVTRVVRVPETIPGHFAEPGPRMGTEGPARQVPQIPPQYAPRGGTAPGTTIPGPTIPVDQPSSDDEVPQPR